MDTFHLPQDIFPGTDRMGVGIEVIDIIRLREGKYVEHWGMSNIPRIIAELSAKR